MATFAERIRKRIEWHQQRAEQLRSVLDARRKESGRPTERLRRGRDGEEAQLETVEVAPPEQRALDAHEGAAKQLMALVENQPPIPERPRQRLQPQRMAPRRRGNFVSKL